MLDLLFGIFMGTLLIVATILMIGVTVAILNELFS